MAFSRRKTNTPLFAFFFRFPNRRLDENAPGAGNRPQGLCIIRYRPMFNPACQPVFVAFMMFFTPVQSPAKAKAGEAAERAAASS